jgi:hypothetical protein
VTHDHPGYLLKRVAGAGIDKKRMEDQTRQNSVVVSTSNIPKSYLSVMSIPVATVIVTAALGLGTVMCRFGVGSIVAIAILIVTRWDRKRVRRSGSHVPTPTHD